MRSPIRAIFLVTLICAISFLFMSQVLLHVSQKSKSDIFSQLTQIVSAKKNPGENDGSLQFPIVNVYTDGDNDVAEVVDVRPLKWIAPTAAQGLRPILSCPPIPPHLVGRLEVSTENVPWQEIESRYMELNPGGRFQPKHCRARHKVAVIVPFRNREWQLKIFTNHLHPILMRQELDYRIYVVNQVGEEFNRAMLFNVGFKEALKDYEWDCFIFHDVDLLPEDDRNLYTCPETPRHMSVAVNTMGYKLPYATIFGGVVAMRWEHIVQVNGFSNQFWGWGGEDDDMANRIAHHKLKVSRYNEKIARYTMVKHKKEAPNPDRVKILKTGLKLMQNDGLVNLKYEVVNVTSTALYTNISVTLERVTPLDQHMPTPIQPKVP